MGAHTLLAAVAKGHGSMSVAHEHAHKHERQHMRHSSCIPSRCAAKLVYLWEAGRSGSSSAGSGRQGKQPPATCGVEVVTIKCSWTVASLQVYHSQQSDAQNVLPLPLQIVSHLTPCSTYTLLSAPQRTPPHLLRCLDTSASGRGAPPCVLL